MLKTFKGTICQVFFSKSNQKLVYVYVDKQKIDSVPFSKALYFFCAKKLIYLQWQFLSKNDTVFGPMRLILKN